MRWLLVMGIVAVAAACGSGVEGDGVSSVSALAEARVEAERLVEEAVSKAATDEPTREDGLGDLPCDPPSSGLVDYDYVLAVDVGDENLGAVVEEAWDYLESEGFEAVGEPPTSSSPSVNGRRGDFLAEILGNREQGVVYVGVTTPCLSADEAPTAVSDAPPAGASP